MILVTRLNGTSFYVNAELIQAVEQTPDTVITLVNEKKVVVRESAAELVNRIIEYRHKVMSGILTEVSETPHPSN
jgi:flagellar protein FlbD